MRKTDINKYGNITNMPQKGAITTTGSLGKMLGKGILTIISIFIIVGVIVGVSLIAFVFSLKNEEMNYDLRKLKLNYTSFIYVNDENGKPVQYQSLYSGENRVWVDYANIPDSMKMAMVAIEDKRFEEHNGVDWRRTFGAVTNLFSEGSNYGGSTITQQLIKNITGDKDVSLTRKVKEIFRARNLEKKYSKDEILETYLNVVNFGSGCNGVQAAANCYFGKNIQDCDIAECAAIGGITQNPSAYTPLVHPDNNKKRQQTVLSEMYSQGKITQTEYNEAIAKSENMTFVVKKNNNSNTSIPVWNWYIDTMIKDITTDLATTYSCSEEKAREMIYHGGLKIYSAMDSQLQSIAGQTMSDPKSLPKNKKIQVGYYAMDYSGRVLATVGARGEKTKNLLLSYATDTKRQPGSCIKPLVDYGPAMNMGVINYSSIVVDEPLKNWANGKPGPKNFNNTYIGNTTVQYALEKSLNAPAARLLQKITPRIGFDFLKDKLHFTSLVPSDETLALSIGGMAGVTVKEMTAGFQIFANGGKYNKPYTYFYAEDHDGNVILDNRPDASEQVVTSETATLLLRLLNTTITGAEGSGSAARISGWEVFGKTGTTNEQKDSWFVGGTPYALAGIWTGYKDTPIAMTDGEKKYAIAIWKNVMQTYLKNKQNKRFEYDSNVVSATYCRETGNLAKPGVCTKTAIGWYDKQTLSGLKTCSGTHWGTKPSLESELPVLPESQSSQGENSSDNLNSAGGTPSSNALPSQILGDPSQPATGAANSNSSKGKPQGNVTPTATPDLDFPNAVG